MNGPRVIPAPHWLALFLWLCAPFAAADEPLPDTIEFNRDIRPILSDKCFKCHGPDTAQRQADLRLDQEAAALADRDGRRAIAPGRPDESELVRRITADDPAERMPPVETGRTLAARQVALLRRWIEQGAAWQPHWSFLPPRRSEPPAVANESWCRNEIDRFVLARLEREGLAPSPEADKITLLRRVSLDLTGLPPTPAEVDDFLADESSDAYERAVERLLDSPRYGERMATRWLDAARYADSNGYQSDGERHMWRWRDWVIEAYNRNLPFDQFTIEQLAGDLLPQPTLDQRIATGFNRNHRGNAEGGIIPEEYAVEYVVDRVDTTSTVWLGLTLGCARCHDHKFDPVTQRDFYRMYAYFNSVPERGRAIKYGNSPPMIPAPTAEQQAELAAVDAEIAAAQSRWETLQPEATSAQAAWEAGYDGAGRIDWTITNGLAARLPLDGDAANAAAGNAMGGLYAAAVRGEVSIARAAGGQAAARFRGGPPAFVPGVSGYAGHFDGTRYIDAGDVAAFGYYDKFTISAWVFADDERGGTIVSRMTDVPQGDGYYVALAGGRVQVNLIKRWLDDACRVETEAALPPGEWHHVAATYDGSRLAAGVRVYIDGAPVPLKVNLDDLNQTYETKEPLRIGGGGGPEGRFRGRLDDVRVYDRVLDTGEVAVVSAPQRIHELLAAPPESRSERSNAKLAAYYLAEQAPEHLRQAVQALADLRARREALVDSFPTTMVMEELPQPRPAYVLLRGEYDKPGEPVERGVPAALSLLPEGAENNRLGFARWLIDGNNPLTARVAVNRYWQMYFGTGIVKTVDDFGAQGEWPSHPELLDWLATEFVRTGWDVKEMQRRIVGSATYRQSSRTRGELLERDPENRLLARGPRVRLSAEMIRDQALLAAGLLVESPGGPSVMPYQPDGLWQELAGEAVAYTQDRGDKLYRRSMYTFWKRTIAPPTMLTFDAAGRETCVVRETRTNTPLQALALMNEVTFVEAARAMAQRVLHEAGPTPSERLTLAFRIATARPPREAELAVLSAGMEAHTARYRGDTAAALALISAGESPRDESLDPAEHAAYTAICSLLLNLDETITKE